MSGRVWRCRVCGNWVGEGVAVFTMAVCTRTPRCRHSGGVVMSVEEMSERYNNPNRFGRK